MDQNGWYYLHVNGELIYKSKYTEKRDLDESDLVRKYWSWDGSREKAWIILIESYDLGGKLSRILELSEKWGFDKDERTMEQVNQWKLI